MTAQTQTTKPRQARSSISANKADESTTTSRTQRASRNENKGGVASRAPGNVEDDTSSEGSKSFSKSQLKSKKRRAVDDEDYADQRTANAYDSDALDEDGTFEAIKAKKNKKTASNSVSPKKSQSPRKRRKQNEEEDYELDEGQEIVGVVVQAPKTGRVAPGLISQNTLDFLTKLKDPECNDREWFKLHEPVYRIAEQEWKDFVEAFTDVLTGVDSQIPHLPPKDVIHRIYRDIRFSNDKTPYKRGFSATFSRSGRKGIFAIYHVMVKPGNESMIAAGTWQPGRNEIATIRSNIQRNPRRLRNTISEASFVELFGEAKRHPKGEMQNIFGYGDELKVAPKGIEKDHKDIDLLKCRSFVVAHKFTDSEALSLDFKEKLADVARVMRPFVHCLNDMMTIGNSNEDDDDEDEEEEEEDAEEDV